MARLMIIAGLLGVTSASDGVALVQVKAERNAHKSNQQLESNDALPGLSTLLPSKEFAEMNAKVEALEHRLSDLKKEDVAAIVRKKQNYEKQLSAQQRENHKVKLANKRISREIRSVWKSNVALRNRSHALAKANGKLRSELGAIQVNLTLTQEFLQQGLSAAAKKASELEVLAELAEMDEHTAKMMQKQARRNEISGSSLSMSLSELSGHAHDRADSKSHGESAEALMQVLAPHMSEIAKEQNAGEAALRAAFEKQKRRVNKQHASLLDEQFQLNRSSAEAHALHQRLSAAVKHLTKVHDNLLARRKAIRIFAHRFGASKDNVGGKKGNKTSANQVLAEKDLISNSKAHRRVANNESTGTRAAQKRSRHGRQQSARQIARIQSARNRTGEKEPRHAVQNGNNGSDTMPSASRANRKSRGVRKFAAAGKADRHRRQKTVVATEHSGARARMRVSARAAVPATADAHSKAARKSLSPVHKRKSVNTKVAGPSATIEQTGAEHHDRILSWMFPKWLR